MLKKILFIALISFLSQLNTQAQMLENSIGISLSALDFYGLQTGHYFKKVMSNSSQQSYWDAAISFSYLRNFSNKIDFKSSLVLCGLYLPSKSKDAYYIESKETKLFQRSKYTFASLQMSVLYAILQKNKYIITPQAEAGFAYYTHREGSGVSHFVGLGMFMNIIENIYANMNVTLQHSFANSGQNHLQYSVGVVYNFGHTTNFRQK